MRAVAALLGRYRHLRTIGAQGCVSAFHFALNLALLRLVPLHDYGVFAFAFVLAMFATAVNHALVSTPLLVYTPVIDDPHERRAKETLLASANLLLCAALVAGGALWALASGNLGATGVGVTLFVAVYSARQYSRSIGYARLAPLVTAAGDIAYVVAGTLLVGALALGTELVIAHVLLALALANLAAMLVERVGLARSRANAADSTLAPADAAGASVEPAAAPLGRGANARPRRRFSLRGYGEIWEQSRWSLAGALTSLVVAQAHSLIVTSTHGPEAFAPLAAGFVLFGPVRVALQTWQNTVKPEIAIGLHAGRLDEVRAQVRRTARQVTLAVLAMGVALALLWPLVHALLYARRYAEEPMAAIVAVWFLVTLVAASYNPASAALQAMKDFRALAIPTIWGAALSATLVGATLAVGTPADTLWGVLAAEALVALWLPRVLRERLTRHPAAPRGGAAERAAERALDASLPGADGAR